MATKKQPGLFGAGLWIIPTITFIGAVFFGVKAWISHTSGSILQTPTGPIESTQNVPLYEIGFFWFFAALLVATIGIILWIRSEK